MALRGNLKDFSLPDVFQLVTFSRKNGVLRIRRAETAGSVWFREGDIYFAQSNWQRAPLGERLVAASRITPQALARGLDIRRAEPSDGRRLGQILVDEGYITEKVLETFVQEQIQDTIFDLMRWDEGDFDFEPLEAASEEDIGLSVSIENVIMEGSRRLEEWTRIKRKVPSTEMVFKMATAPGEGTFEISLKPVEWNLLLRVDGTRSVAELATETGRTDFEIARVIYGLFSAGLLEVPTDDEVERLRAESAERGLGHSDASAPVAVEGEMPVEVGYAPVVSLPEALELGGSAPEPEMPEFLADDKAVPSAEDMAVFEQMMGAVLEPSAAVSAPAAPAAMPAAPVESEEADVPFVPGVFEPMSESGSAETVESAAPAAAPTPELTGDLEKDIMALGLGELPVELEAEPADVEAIGTKAAPHEGPDLSDLLTSLSKPENEPTQVISTDAYLAEFDGDVGLTSVLGDELTALTGGGAGRPRLQASVNRIPEATHEGKTLQRDQGVDRDLVMRIIEGIKQL
ncbi:MAG: DUF4388 domain-containing protein [Coriobacteriia bacterium]